MPKVVIWLLVGLGIALLICLFMWLHAKKKMVTVRLATNASNYVEQNTIDIVRVEDSFLYQTEERIYDPVEKKDK